MNVKKIIFSLACITIILTTALFFIRDFNLYWVKVNNEEATVTINFLIPMNQEALQKSIQIENHPAYDHNYTYSIEWFNKRSCALTLTEITQVKGQRIILHIQDAPTQYNQITKTLSIPIQFKSDILLSVPEETPIIATDQPFMIHFNTPINPQQIHQYVDADASFSFKPLQKTTPQKQVVEDFTSYQVTPIAPLLNEHNYVLSFRKGLPAQSGVLLDKDQKFIVQTDQKPKITSILPGDSSKWIGLFPRIVVESSTPMATATITLNKETLKGTLKTPYYAVFYPTAVLLPETNYTMAVSIASKTGEYSPTEQIHFTTVPIHASRIWVEIIDQDTPMLNVYQGSRKIQTFNPMSNLTTFSNYGTYYINDKSESYMNPLARYGANYCLNLTEDIKIHGLLRDDYWQVKSDNYITTSQNTLEDHLILTEEDITWLYNNLPMDTMVIIHP